MTVPTTFVVTGTWTNPDTTPASGTVSFKATAGRFANSGNLIRSKVVTGTLDSTGAVGPPTRSFADAVTNTSTTLTSATAAFTSADVGKTVVGTGPNAADIFAGTTIASVTNATTVVLSHATTGTHTGVGIILGGGGIKLVQATAGYDVTENLAGRPAKTYHIAGTGNISITPSVPSNMTCTGVWYTDDDNLATGSIQLVRSADGQTFNASLDGAGSLGAGLIVPQDAGGYDVTETIIGQAAPASYHIAATTSTLDLSTV